MMKNNEYELDFEEYRSIQLYCLKKFADFCDKNKIKYFIVCGTALGAIRHKGYIPWDDDIDVAIPWYEYERVCELIKYEEEIDIDTCFNNEKRWSISDFDIVLKDTKRITSYEGANRIAIDVFIFDKVPKNKFLQTIFYFVTGLLINISYAKLKTEKGKNAFIEFIKSVVRFIFYFVSSRQLCIVLQKILNFTNTKLKDENCLIGNISRKNEVHDINFDLDTIPVQFELFTFEILKEYDKVLRDNYGDYMRLPDVEDRKSTHNESRDFIVNNDRLLHYTKEITNARMSNKEKCK